MLPFVSLHGAENLKPEPAVSAEKPVMSLSKVVKQKPPPPALIPRFNEIQDFCLSSTYAFQM